MSRALWSGHLQIGLLALPVRLHKATDSVTSVTTHLHNRVTGNRIRNRQVDEVTGDEVAREDIVKGVDLGDRVVLLEPSELAEIRPTRDDAIVIEQFVPQGDITPMRIDEPYFLVAGPGGDRPLALVRELLAELALVGLAQVVLNSKQHLVMLAADDDGMNLVRVRYDAQLRARPGQVADVTFTEAERDLARNLVATYRLDEADFSAFSSDHHERVQELVHRRSEDPDAVVTTQGDVPTYAPNDPDALVASLSEALAARRTS